MSVKLFNYNLVNSERYAAVSTYSEDTDFPVENVEDGKRRGRVYRTAGYRVVDANNKTIRFSENSGGGYFSVTLTEAAYTSDAELFEEIKNVMEAAGANTYAVERDPDTLLFVISVVSGTAANFILSTTHVSMAGFCTLMGYDDSVDHGSGESAETIVLHDEERIIWDMGSAVNPQAVIIAGSRNSAIKISNSATVKIQGSSTNAWVTPEFTSTLTVNDDIIYSLSATGLHSSALRYWSISVVDKANPNGFVEIGAVYIGDYYETSTGTVQFPYASSKQDNTKLSKNVDGGVISFKSQKTEQLSISWFALTNAEKEEIEDHWEAVGLHSPFWVQFDPDNVFSTDRRMFKMLRFVSPPSFTLSAPTVWSSSWQVAEEV